MIIITFLRIDLLSCFYLMKMTQIESMIFSI